MATDREKAKAWLKHCKPKQVLNILRLIGMH